MTSQRDRARDVIRHAAGHRSDAGHFVIGFMYPVVGWIRGQEMALSLPI